MDPIPSAASTRRHSAASLHAPSRHFSLPPDNDILTTRGQQLPYLLERFSLSTSPDSAWSPSHRMQGEDLWRSEHHDMSFDEDDIGNETFVQTRRGMRLIGENNNPRYKWHRYYKTQEELRKFPKAIRKYYERNNHLVSQYLYIDRLLDSPLPRRLVEEYNANQPAHLKDGVSTLSHAPHPNFGTIEQPAHLANGNGNANNQNGKIKRTPRNLYRVPSHNSLPHTIPDEEQPLLDDITSTDDDHVETGDRIVKVAIWVNLIANILLLLAKVVVMTLTNSMSVLASLVDGALDFLSTAIIWTTTTLIGKQDRYGYPAGRRRLEPLGVLIFSIIMITSFGQVALVSVQRLTSPDHTMVQLSTPAIIIMAATVVIKLVCWVWCRLVKNSSVQALAQDAMTDVVFNFFSIVFPLLGSFTNLWYLDPLGGLFLSIYVMLNWSSTASEHIRTLTGAAADPDDRNVLLYMTMRFAKLIEKIQGLEAYHSGDKLIVEVDIVLNEKTSFRDSHDLGESLQYMLESVPTVDRAFVHLDYATVNLPTHMNQQAENDP